MKKIEVYLYGETHTKHGSLGGQIFPTYLIFQPKLKMSKEFFLENFKKGKRHTYDITDEYKKNLTFDAEFKNLEWVTKKTGKWIPGEYYAHEYGEYVEGRARLITYSNEFKEVEVECLDKEKNVLDGMWEYDGPGQLGNGCGDYFTPFERMK